MAASGTGALCLLFTDEIVKLLFFLLRFRQTLQNRWTGFTVQMDIDPKYSVKATQKLLKANKCNVLKWQSQCPNLTPAEFALHFISGEDVCRFQTFYRLQKGFVSKYQK